MKILDFGSVRINKNRQMSKLTSMGTTIGSPYYMSPEQAQGAEGLDHRADVFALGAIVYESLVGQVPFSGANGPAILLAILTKNPPPISTRIAGMPAALDDVIDDALAKKPEMRTGSVGAFADSFGRAFGLPGDHTAWAKMTVAQLEAQMGAAIPAPPPPTAVADPFAVQTADPFAAPPPPPPPPGYGQPPGYGAAAPLYGGPQVYGGPQAAAPGYDARLAMDDAFAAAQNEPAGVPSRPIGLIVGLCVAGLLVVGAVLFFVLH
ncbi:MAG: protein kinase [Myxococcales bacterium]|nr:protein kinase [Myxococcales bacterium]